jgi:hypothetical protein
MCHVSNAGLGCSVWRRRNSLHSIVSLHQQGISCQCTNLVWSVWSHGRCKYNCSLYPELYKSLGSNSSTIERSKKLGMCQWIDCEITRRNSTYVDCEQRLDLLCCEIKSRFVVCSARITHDSVEAASFSDCFVNRGLDAGLLGAICSDEWQTVWESLRDYLEFVSWFRNVDGIDFWSSVHETAFCNTKTNSTVCSGNFPVRLATIRNHLKYGHTCYNFPRKSNLSLDLGNARDNGSWCWRSSCLNSRWSHFVNLKMMLIKIQVPETLCFVLEREELLPLLVGPHLYKTRRPDTILNSPTPVKV